MSAEDARDQFITCAMRSPTYGTEPYSCHWAADGAGCQLDIGPKGMLISTLGSAEGPVWAPWSQVHSAAHAKGELSFLLPCLSFGGRVSRARVGALRCCLVSSTSSPESPSVLKMCSHCRQHLTPALG